MKLGVLAIVVTAWFTVAAQPASAFCVVGDPVASGGHWSQRFQQGKLGAMDHIRVDWIAGSRFELPIFGDFSEPSWSVLWELPDRGAASTETPSTDVQFDVRFQGTPDSPTDFYLTAFLGDKLLECARATWSGDKCAWVIVPDDVFEPDPENPGVVPEPLTVVLLSGALGVSGLIARRKKRQD